MTLRAPVLTGDDAEQALTAAHEVANACAHALFDHKGHLRAASVNTFCGLAIVIAALEEAGRPITTPLRDAVEEMLVETQETTLFEGCGAVLATMDALDPHERTFVRPRTRLRARVAEDVLATSALDPFDHTTYDLIVGLAGRCIALGRPYGPMLPHVLRLLDVHATTLDALLTSGAEPNSVDLGVAHGVAGVLAAINIVVPHERALAARYVSIVRRSAVAASEPLQWPARFPADSPFFRPSWCYGSLGIAAVLADRAEIDGDEMLALTAGRAADKATEAAIATNSDAMPCHGSGGVALLLARFDDNALRERAARIARSIVLARDRAAPFGYRALVGDQWADLLGLLNGALGVAMVLAYLSAPTNDRWLRLFGLVPSAITAEVDRK